jgi:hypothetical protein
VNIAIFNRSHATNEISRSESTTSVLNIVGGK